MDRDAQEDVTWGKIKFNLPGNAALHRGRILVCPEMEVKAAIAVSQPLASLPRPAGNPGGSRRGSLQSRECQSKIVADLNQV